MQTPSSPIDRCHSLPSPPPPLAAVFSFLGVFIMTLLNARVAETITKMVDFGTDPDLAILSLSAALFAIVLWATLALGTGHPSECVGSVIMKNT